MRVQTKGPGFGIFLFLLLIFFVLFLFSPPEVMFNSLKYFFNRSLGSLLQDPIIIASFGGLIFIVFVLLAIFSARSGLRGGR